MENYYTEFINFLNIHGGRKPTYTYYLHNSIDLKFGPTVFVRITDNSIFILTNNRYQTVTFPLQIKPNLLYDCLFPMG